MKIKPVHERRATREYIDANILESKEAIEVLGFSRNRLNQLVQEGKIKPVRKGLGIYTTDDVVALKYERKNDDVEAMKRALD